MANMFGALNRFISRLDADPNVAAPGLNRQHSNQNSTTHYGFQVMRNTNTSLPLEPWFDFIIGINGHNIENPDPNLFTTEVRNCAGSTISLGIYGAKGSKIREIYISVPAAGEPLGLALQWSPLSAVENVWHILDVMPNSPADVAGLLPYSDYVLASPETAMLHGDAALGHLIERFLDQPLRLYVYNHEYDVTRLVTLTPSKSWGGEGSLGCVLGYGALHRIPAPLTEPSTDPGETLFSSDQPMAAGPALAYQQEGQDAPSFLVPANMPQLNAVSPPPPPGGTSPSNGPPPMASRTRKARAHPAPAAGGGGGLDDYFAEGEQKSRELDNAPTPKSTGGLPPPPPKAGAGGGPPRSGASPANPAPVDATTRNEVDHDADD